MARATFEPPLPTDLAAARVAAVEPERIARIGAAIANHVFDEKISGHLLVVAIDDATARALLAHAEKHWRAIALAMNVSMSHMDPADLTDALANELSARVKAMDAARFVMAGAPILASTTFVFASEASREPREAAGFAVAYVDAPCDVVATRVIDVGRWRAVRGSAP